MRNGLLLIIAAKFILPALGFASLWVFLRGHNAPGGGFIGGLIGAMGFSMLLLTYGEKKTRHFLPFDPRSLMGIGLLTALGATLAPIYYKQGFFQGLWTQLHLPLVGEFEIGTPQLFDLGVYLVVIGSLMIILFSLWED